MFDTISNRAFSLSDEAYYAARQFNKALSREIINKLELAHVAEWIYTQDESIPGHHILQVAHKAIAIINSRYKEP